MGDTHTLEHLPVVDDQDDTKWLDLPLSDDQVDGVCVRAAASKAIVAGLWHSKWTESRLDADQEVVLGLLHRHKNDNQCGNNLYLATNPTYLHGRHLRIQN